MATVAESLDGVIAVTPTGSTTKRKLKDRAADVLSVKDFGAKGDGVATLAAEQAAFQAAYDACPAYGAILIPAGTYPQVTLTGSKFVLWRAEGQPATGTIFNLPGLVEQGIATRKVFSAQNTTATDYAGVEHRRITNHTGGTAGNVSSALRVYTSAASGATNYEWAFLAQLDNYATAGQNVAAYAQAKKKVGAAGPTWAGVFEVRNDNNTGETGGGLVGIEVDVMANGADTNTNRVGLDLIVGKANAGGTANAITAGIRMGPQGGITADASIFDGIRFNGAYTQAINFQGTATTAVNVGGSATHAYDASNCTLTGAALRMARSQPIYFEPTGAWKMYADASVSKIRIDNSGERVGFLITATPALYLNGTQVVSIRDTGWAPMTGTSDKATTYDTSTITLPQLAGRVMALQAMMTTAHGLIGA